MHRRSLEVSNEAWDYFKKLALTEGRNVSRVAGEVLEREYKISKVEQETGRTHTPRTTQMRQFLQQEIEPGGMITETAAYNLIETVFPGTGRRKFLEVVAEIRLSSAWEITRVGKDRYFRRTGK